MIVRIATEGQYELDSSYLDKLNAIDNDIVNAIADGDRARYQKLFNQLLELVRRHGTPVDVDELVESQVVLPPPDTTFDEAEELFVGEGMFTG
ncbi:MAG TPA: hypothetical protein VFU72_01415 [Nitrolancea sp.]|nr:hypothetical protein [Nitrolancea sp.]